MSANDINQGDRAMTADPHQRAATGPRLSITLPAHGQAAGMARRAIQKALRSWDLEHLAETAALLVSELVGNVLRHARTGGAPLELRLAATGNRLRIEVVDADPRAPAMRIPSADVEGGYGLVLVEALADDWGAQPTPNGKVVWIELRTGAEVETAGHPEAREAINSRGPARPHGLPSLRFSTGIARTA